MQLYMRIYNSEGAIADPPKTCRASWERVVGAVSNVPPPTHTQLFMGCLSQLLIPKVSLGFGIGDHHNSLWLRGGKWISPTPHGSVPHTHLVPIAWLLRGPPHL